MKNIVIRALIQKRTCAPVNGVIPNEKDPYIVNEEGCIAVYGMYSKKNFSTLLAVYKFIDGLPHPLGFYKLRGTSGCEAWNQDHQGALNWGVGLIERAVAGNLQIGSYFLPIDIARDINAREMSNQVSAKQCVDMASGLQVGRERGTFEVMQIDEDGAPESMSPITIRANKLRQIITNRLFASLWAKNEEIVEAWHNALLRGRDLFVSHDHQTAITAVEQIRVSLHELLTGHCHQHWMDEEQKWIKPYYERMERKISKIFNFFPKLVENVETFNLKVCQINPEQIPLFVGIKGSPIVVGELDLPDNFRFPNQWTVSPFESVMDTETKKTFDQRHARPERMRVLHSTPKEPDPIVTETPVQELCPVHAGSSGGSQVFNSFQLLPQLE